MRSSQSHHHLSSSSPYTGLKLFGRPTVKTNLILIQNAILEALKGAANARTLSKMQETIATHSETCPHFLILFRNHQQFRGLYEFSEKQSTITKLDGIGPKTVLNEDVIKYYKFDSPKRRFVEVQTERVSLTIIAFSIQDHLWSKAPTSVGNKSVEAPQNGSRLYSRSAVKTNLILIQNAILEALKGAANARTLSKMQETIATHSETCPHFLILFRNHQQFRGLYEYSEKQNTITKLDGVGPKTVSNQDIIKYYKFDSPKRRFVEVQTEHISLTIIAFLIQDHLWPKGTLNKNGPQTNGNSSVPENLVQK